MAVSANRLELLQIADAVAREKNIEKGVVLEAMEEAIQKSREKRNALLGMTQKAAEAFKRVIEHIEV